ncbi:intraflagellar transport protein 52 homolog isoform X2 [Maniola jurtina]|uniref:intraflagellar transport protein 52 homolog isoform X2 n=1 Tax=Maniola jurtina TaxID=191418 RepID=UPI001E6886B4|nr:intraflagellar transport protein 52 homolog isoform X2 [Maniola jurtina]
MKAIDTILFDISKNELFKINENFKMLHRKLKSAWKVMINREEISPHILQDVKILVIPGPQNAFTDDELAALKSVVERGDSVLVMMTDGGEERMNTNINFFLEEYGIVVNNDCVVRAKYHRFYHPKECHISNGILNRAVLKYIMKMPNYISESDDFLEDPPTPNFVYPYGATLTVKKPSAAMFSSSDVCYPVKRPVAAMYISEKSGGKLFVIGSGHFFADQYLDSECNDLIREMIFNYLGGVTDFHLNAIDVEDPDINEYRTLGDTLWLSSVLLPEPASAPPPRLAPLHPHALFTWTLFSLNLSHLPEVLGLYEELGVKHEPLRLIAPQFETPFPPLQLAGSPSAAIRALRSGRSVQLRAVAAREAS